MPKLTESNLCKDLEFARKAAFIWEHDMIWRDTVANPYRVRDLNDMGRREKGHRWVKFGEREFFT